MPIEIAAAAIQAIKFVYAVGNKISEVFVDESVMRELRIPRPRLTKSPDAGPDVVREFFESADGQVLLERMPDVRTKFDSWEVVDDETFLKDLLPIFLSYRTASKVTVAKAADRVGYLTVKAYLDGARPVNTAFQRILGEVVNQGLDFLAANPGTLGVDARVSGILQPVIEGLAERDFAEEKYDVLLRGACGAVLGGLNGLVETKVGSKGVRLLTSNLVASLKETLDNGGAAEFDNYLSLRGPLIQGLLRTAATTVSVNSKVFFGKDRALVQGLVLPLVDRIKDEQGDLFTPENGSALLGAAIGALGSQASFLVKIKDARKAGFVVGLLQDLGTTLSKEVTAGGFETFDVETLFRDLGSSALTRVGENLPIFLKINDGNPNHQLAVSAAAATLGALKTALGKPGDVFDQDLLKDWMDRVFVAVGENFALRDQLTADSKKSALYQVVGSVGRAVGTDSSALLNREGRLELLTVALEAIETQAPLLLDLTNDDLKSNLLDVVLQGVFKAANAAVAGKAPLSQTVLLDLVRGTLQGAVDAVIVKKLPNEEAGEILRQVVKTILDSWSKGSLSMDAALEKLPEIVQAALIAGGDGIEKLVLAQLSKKGTNS